MSTDFMDLMAHPGPQEVTVEGHLLRPGSRVRLRPEQGRDLLDSALAGKVAVIEGIDEDDAGVAQLAVVVEDDPGRDLGMARNPAHRFFFKLHEVEPLDEPREQPRRVLVAGIGNVFHGDDGFGVAVAQRLQQRQLPAGVEVVDFGIRGMDLAYALTGGYHAAILVDAVPCGRIPGNLCIIEPEHVEVDRERPDAHQMNPLAVLKLAQTLGTLPAHLLIVGCEPECFDPAAEESMAMELSARISAAVDPAADLVVDLAGRFVSEGELATLKL